jgi:hypothetical protein
MDAYRRRFLASAVGAFLSGCGGGGSAAPEFIGAATVPHRPGVLYGYWGDDAEAAADTGDHANLYVAAHWNGGAAGAIANIDRAKKAGFKKLLVMLDAVRADRSIEATVTAINDYMGLLAQAGSLDGIELVGLMWCDEPNGLPEAYVRGVNTMLRALTSLPLWVCFAASGARPGLEALDDPRGAFDRVAFDNYDIGDQVLGSLMTELAQRMKPGAMRFLVPGPVGGHFSQADPTQFENFAYAHADVVAIVTFIWINGWANNPANLGIKSIAALRATYTALGKRLTGKP